MKEKLSQIKAEALEQLYGAEDLKSIQDIRVRFLGKKGELTSVLRGMGALAPEQRPIIGELANQIRSEIETSIESFKSQMQQKNLMQKLEKEKIDVTMPGKFSAIGKKHPISIVLDEIKDIFIGMGFSIAEGPEIEYVRYNFDALNMPQNHPARDTRDTFYINDEVLLRTQTSPVQVRVMEKINPPIKIISPGRVYRADEVDATHSPLFHQVEGLVVDKGIRMSDLKGTLDLFATRLYGENAKIRFRPHHFSFTEPSAEVDICCFACDGAGCRLCKGEGWIEILGAGMVHPNVLENCNIDSNVYNGFAFGLGLERVVMRRFAIDDLRLLFENDQRFLNQF